MTEQEGISGTAAIAFLGAIAACEFPEGEVVFRDDFTERDGSGRMVFGNGGCQPWINPTSFQPYVRLPPPPFCMVLGIHTLGAGESLGQTPMTMGQIFGNGGYMQFFYHLPSGPYRAGAVAYSQAPDPSGIPGVGIFDLTFDTSKHDYFMLLTRTVEGVTVTVMTQDRLITVTGFVPESRDPSYPAGFFGGFNVEDRYVLFTNRFNADMVSGLQISTAPGWGWVWFMKAGAANLNNTLLYNQYTDSWRARVIPGGSLPANAGSFGTGPIDAACAAAVTPAFPRSTSEDSVNVNPTNPDEARLLYHSQWAWNSADTNLANWGTFQADGRMIVRQHRFISFKAPVGATSVEISGRVYANAPETGGAGFGSQPAPSGEGAISYEIWGASYHGFAVDAASRTVLASGSVTDYVYRDGVLTGDVIMTSDSFSGSMLIDSEGEFQLGAKITNSDGDLINSHGPAAAHFTNSGCSRHVDLKVDRLQIKFRWGPIPCGDPSPIHGAGGAGIVIPATGALRDSG